MLVFGTQMHIVTFIFVSIEIVIFFYLVIYRLARPDDKIAFLNIGLIFLLIIYNLTGGLLPDPNLPGSYFIQVIIAYATGFVVPCYFPYYVYKVFGLTGMKFHAYKGIFIFLLLPYILFVFLFWITGNLEIAKYLLILPVLYALWVVFTLLKAVKAKYYNNFYSYESREEAVVLISSLTPWVGLPIIDFFNMGQAIEAIITNTGFLLLLSLKVKTHIKQSKSEHQRLVDSELRLLNWNTNLQKEVDKRTNELERINEQKTHTFINLVHETKTPLTLVNNYLEEYINIYGSGEELDILKSGVNKLTRDITSLFDIERFEKGIDVYNHNQTSNFSNILKESLVLFEYYCQKQIITCHKNIEDNVYIKADPNAIDRVVNNLIENSIKFTAKNGKIEIVLKTVGDNLHFSVNDTGIGIPHDLQRKIFDPYFQINHNKTALQGMGLGLPIVKKVVDSLDGEIQITSSTTNRTGTKVNIILTKHDLGANDIPAEKILEIHSSSIFVENFDLVDNPFLPERYTIFVVEDNKAMLKFLLTKLNKKYNTCYSLNGAAALKKIAEIQVLPDLIISDIMMDKMDGFTLAKLLSEQTAYKHIPIIFLSAKSTPTDKLKGLRLGAVDFISKPFSMEELGQKIETLLSNIDKQKKAFINTSLANLQSLNNIGLHPLSEDERNTSKFDQNCKMYNLTKRELEVINLMIRGDTYKMIAKTLFISDRTVTKHIQNVFDKVDVSNKLEMVNKLQT